MEASSFRMGTSTQATSKMGICIVMKSYRATIQSKQEPVLKGFTEMAKDMDTEG